MIAHLNAEGRDGKVHEAWKGFFDRYEAWTVSLYNLQQIHNISDAIKAVYIVENPSVFRSLFLEGKRLGKEQIGFVCTNGQLNLCGYVLLDLIQKSNIPMYYAGDFDPEGILIADRLKQRYKDDLHLWKVQWRIIIGLCQPHPSVKSVSCHCKTAGVKNYRHFAENLKSTHAVVIRRHCYPYILRK